MSQIKLARNNFGKPYMKCGVCGHRSDGWNQAEVVCPECLQLWLEEQGLPMMRYVREEE